MFKSDEFFLALEPVKPSFSFFLTRAVAQLGRALGWGPRGRGFKSRRPEITRSHEHERAVAST